MDHHEWNLITVENLIKNRSFLFGNPWKNKYLGIKRDTRDPPHFKQTEENGIIWNWSSAYDEHHKDVRNMLTVRSFRIRHKRVHTAKVKAIMTRHVNNMVIPEITVSHLAHFRKHHRISVRSIMMELLGHGIKSGPMPDGSLVCNGENIKRVYKMIENKEFTPLSFLPPEPNISDEIPEVPAYIQSIDDNPSTPPPPPPSTSNGTNIIVPYNANGNDPSQSIQPTINATPSITQPHSTSNGTNVIVPSSTLQPQSISNGTNIIVPYIANGRPTISDPTTSSISVPQSSSNGTDVIVPYNHDGTSPQQSTIIDVVPLQPHSTSNGTDVIVPNTANSNGRPMIHAPSTSTPSISSSNGTNIIVPYNANGNGTIQSIQNGRPTEMRQASKNP